MYYISMICREGKIEIAAGQWGWGLASVGVWKRSQDISLPCSVIFAPFSAIAAVVDVGIEM